MMVTVPKWLQMFYPSLEWEVKDGGNNVYLTFDDGPHPEITSKVLDILDEYNAKATFFCVADNVRKYPEVYQQIIERGHKTGNHSYHHLNGWKTKNKIYFDDVEQAAGLIESNLFRPPYGKITRHQIKTLKNRYRIIMWSVLTYDFRKSITPETCLQHALSGLNPGSIIVFHDSEKSAKNLFFALPEFLKQCKEKNLKVSSL